MTKIEWTDVTWNPTRGCSKVSAGCTNCYAMRQAHRQNRPGGAYEGLTRLVNGKGPQWTGDVHLVPEKLDEPLSWRKPRRVFVDSMSDLFHEDVPDAFVDQVFATMALAPQHTFQILTKRSARMMSWAQRNSTGGRIFHLASQRGRPQSGAWPLPNVWLGTSVEDQAAADERIPHLLETPAAVRFLSCEPLLGPVDLDAPLGLRPVRDMPDRAGNYDAPSGSGLDWVILGGESGPNARPCNVEWIRSLLRQCRDAGVAAFTKQLGRWIVGDYSSGFSGIDRWLLEDGSVFVPPVIGPHTQSTPRGAVAFSLGPKGGEPEWWAPDLRVREFPEVAHAP